MYPVLLLLAFLPATLSAQLSTSPDTLPLPGRYALSPWLSVPLIAGGGYLAVRRYGEIHDLEPLTSSELGGLNPERVNSVDRYSLEQEFDDPVAALDRARYLRYVGQAAPLTLFLFKRYRQNWLDISLMYLEAQVVHGLFYGYFPVGPGSVNTYRPEAYYSQVRERERGDNRNQRYSGFVGTTATGLYFTARMIDDHHPRMRPYQRTLIYTAFTLPSLAVGALRIQGLRSYPSDVVAGLFFGSISGILVPNLHRWWRKRHRSKLSLSPVYSGTAGGLAISLRY